MFVSTRRTIVAAACALALAIAAAAWASSPASASASSAWAIPPVCTTGKLAVWVNANQSSGAAGTIAYPLEITNLTGRTCRIWGFPGVSLTTISGRQLGDAAGRSHLFAARWVNIAPHGTAHADLFWSDAAVYTSGCKPVTASLVKVYPPDQYQARFGFFGLKACSLKNHPYLRVTVVRPGPNLDV